MGRIVAIGGGTLESTESLNKYTLSLSGKERPKVLFVPTAARDNSEYIESFTAAFQKLNAEVRTLELISKHISDSKIDDLVSWADVIYVGGGNTIFMMKTWEERGFDSKLKAVFANDSAVLSGNGAGCSCWFNCGYSNSAYYRGETDWQYIWADNLLDLHHTAVCPHYNEEGRANFDQRLLEKGIPGFALEDNTAFVQSGDHSEFLASDENAKAFYLIYLNGEMLKKEISLKYI